MYMWFFIYDLGVWELIWSAQLAFERLLLLAGCLFVFVGFLFFLF